MLVQFIPHGHCYLWQTNLVGLHLISDLLIALSYYSIPITLIYFVRQRKDLPYARTFILFSAFIVSCGTSHLAEIWTLWHPTYWMSGTIKAVTALISFYTAMEMFSVVPEALNLPSPSQLESINKKLVEEILERKQMEASLIEEKAFIKTMLDNLSSGIVACDRQGVLTIFNRASQDFHGLPKQAIAADRWSEYYDLYFPDGKTRMNQDDIPLFRALQGESVRDVEMVIIPKQGKARTLLANSNPVIDRYKRKLGAIAVMQDITERKQVEQALHRSELTIKSFYDSAPMMMGIVELIDREDFRHVSDNNMAAAFFGLTPKTLAGKSAELIIPQEVQRRLIAACLQSEAKSQPVNFEFTYKAGKDAKHFLAIVSIISQEYQRERPLFSYIIDDISDRILAVGTQRQFD